MQKKNVLHSPRLLELKRHRRQVFLSKVLLSILTFSSVFALLAYISRFSSFNISSVEITGNKVIEATSLFPVVKGQHQQQYPYLLWHHSHI